jgi:hypothetical protein
MTALTSEWEKRAVIDRAYSRQWAAKLPVVQKPSLAMAPDSFYIQMPRMNFIWGET